MKRQNEAPAPARRGKKLLSAALALTMCMTLLPQTALAAQTGGTDASRTVFDALGISEKTVSNRLTTIYEKLGLDGQTLHKRQALIRILEQSGMQ